MLKNRAAALRTTLLEKGWLQIAGAVAQLEREIPRARSYRSTSKFLVAAEEPFKKTSSVYFPVGHPSGFEM